MPQLSPRSALLSGTAFGAAVIWGTLEFFALQWSRFRGHGLFRA